MRPTSTTSSMSAAPPARSRSAPSRVDRPFAHAADNGAKLVFRAAPGLDGRRIDAPVHRAMDGFRVTMMFPSWRLQNRRRYSSWLPGTSVTVVPAPAFDKTLRITSLWSWVQYGRALQAPEVDDVADEVQELAFVPVEKVEQGSSLTARRAQVRVADPDGIGIGPLPSRGVLLDRGIGDRGIGMPRTHAQYESRIRLTAL